ncbi:cytochrome c [Pseudoruegeria sp. HB172150]|uniref:cytochrome c n=1 Tax=Pseudoruegeria sp. HB172150 TaxID=2721164 RepID=UPI001552F620|nr:cytochrome c [Pseudoruegeria sp. HB172150]
MRIASITLLGAAIAVAGSVVLAASHVNVEGAIKARKAHMQLNAYNLGILGNMAKGDVDFDADAAQRAADNLAALAAMDTTAYWPPGSSNADVEDTRALPAMWDNIPDVLEKVAALQAATEAMAGAAGTLEGVQANMGGIGGACGACHQSYRQTD